MSVLVIGNGESRKFIKIKDTFKNYILVGCNAIHRDMSVHHLVCSDRRMIEEALASKNITNTIIHTRKDYYNYYNKNFKNVEFFKTLPYQGKDKADDPIHWGSGPYAVLTAAQMESENDIYLLGFDLYPTDNKFNNIYKDSINYQKSNSSPIDFSFWEYQISKVFENFPNKSFTVLNHEDWKMPRLWKFPNVTFTVLATKNLTLA